MQSILCVCLQVLHEGAQYAFFMESKLCLSVQVLQGGGQYAFLMESSSIEYATERYCRLQQVGGLLDAKSYGITLPTGEAYACLLKY